MNAACHSNYAATATCTDQVCVGSFPCVSSARSEICCDTCRQGAQPKTTTETVIAERIRSSSVYSTGAFRLIATEDPMFMNNDFSEQPKIHTVGVLPTRRPAEYYQELKPNDPAVHAMTDFTSKFAITVAPDRQISAALADMVRLTLRAMLVVRADS